VNVLVVDDDHDLVELLRFALGRLGFRVTGVTDATQALRAAVTEAPEVIVLDVNLAGWSGFDLLQEIRKRSEVPVIMLTARGSEEDKIRGLSLGADDYVAKPFGHRELAARIRAVARRGGPAPTPASGRLRVGTLELDEQTYTLTKRGEPVSLTVNEFRFLKRLMQEADVVVPTGVLLQHVWGYPPDQRSGDVIRVLVHRLRRKIEDDPGSPTLLVTVPGIGVRLATHMDVST